MVKYSLWVLMMEVVPEMHLDNRDLMSKNDSVTIEIAKFWLLGKINLR